jgi:hypothetical protein
MANNWRFSFSLRLFLTVVLLFAVATAWISEKGRRSRRLQADIRASGGSAGYDTGEDKMRMLVGLPPAKPHSFIRRFQLQHPEFFFHIAYVSVHDQKLAPQVRAALSRLPRLSKLEVDDTDFNDGDLARLTCSRHLGYLDCQNTRLTDRGATLLTQFDALQTLNLGGTAITDKGLEQLVKLSSLRTLWLDEYRDGRERPWNHRLSDEAVARLREALPGCSVNGTESLASRAKQRNSSASGVLSLLRHMGKPDGADEVEVRRQP